MTNLAAATTTASQGWLPGALMAAGVLAVTIVSLRLWRRNRKKAMSIANGPGPRERLKELSLTKQRDSIESLIVDLQETARSCAAQVENRAARLEALMRQTDQKIAKLKDALEQVEQPAPSPAPVSRPVEPATPRPGLRLETERDSRTARMLKMHAEGASAADIARELGEELGKVQLILSLNATAESSDRATA